MLEADGEAGVKMKKQYVVTIRSTGLFGFGVYDVKRLLDENGQVVTAEQLERRRRNPLPEPTLEDGGAM